MNGFRWWACAGSVLLAFVLAAPAHAFRVEPMSYVLGTTGAEARQTLRIENTYSRPLALEVVVYRRTMSAAGELVQEPAPEDFLIFPPQTLIAPGASQAIRVQYVGEPGIATGRAYTVSIRQVSVAGPEDDTAGIEVLFNFGTAAYVVPRGARPDVQVVATETDPAHDRFRVHLQNHGARHGNLQELRWTLRDQAGASHILEGELLESSLRNPIIYAGGERRIDLPLPSGLTAEGLQVDLGAHP